MKEDYLWDRSGAPDPEIEKLEDMLRPFRYHPQTFELRAFPMVEPQTRRRGMLVSWATWRPAQAAAAMLLVVLAGIWWFLRVRTAYEVVSLDGAPIIEAERVAGKGRLHVGGWLETDAVSRARITVGDIGEVEIEPNTRIGLVRARPSEHRLSLRRGTIHAYILAPPRQFFVNTPSAEAIDYGCAYTLQVDENGSGTLSVSSGWVAFEQGGRESFVPAGAVCNTRADLGPGTPFRSAASPAFKQALGVLDFGPETAKSRATAMSILLAEARRDDALTLWHLLFRVDEAERASVYRQLAVLVPPPANVTREKILRHDRQALDLWWDQLGLGSIEWWRMWKTR